MSRNSRPPDADLRAKALAVARAAVPKAIARLRQLRDDPTVSTKIRRQARRLLIAYGLDDRGGVLH